MIVSEKKKKLNSSLKIAEFMNGFLRKASKVDRAKEHFWAIGFNTQKIAQYVELVSLGTLTYAPAHARETYRTAIMRAVDTIAIVHNHPSGSKKPSADDMIITVKLRDAGKVIGIELIDHIIITGSDYYSFADKSVFLPRP